MGELRLRPRAEAPGTTERMTRPTLSLVAASFKRFNGDKCWTSAIVISYFALLCCVPLIALFFTIAGRFLGNTEMALRSLNIFTDEFFAKLDPSFFKSLGDLSSAVGQLGLFGVVGSLISASFLFSSLITTINQIFRTKYHRSFFYNRLIEFLMMAVVGIFMLFSLAMTAVWTAFGRTLQKSELVRATLNPEALAVINNVFLKYVIPYVLTFLMFFILYKFIPEVKVHTRAGLIPAAVAALLFEVFKRAFAFYVVHFSALGIVLSKILQGTLTSVLFFLLWISSSMVILLWGAELAARAQREVRRGGRGQGAEDPAGGKPGSMTGIVRAGLESEGRRSGSKRPSEALTERLGGALLGRYLRTGPVPVRCAWLMSSMSLALGRTPTTFSLSSPPLNRIRVGMAMTP